MEDNLPPPIQVTSSGSGNNKTDDDPLFEAKINNPFSKFFNWIKNFLKSNQNITVRRNNYYLCQR